MSRTTLTRLIAVSTGSVLLAGAFTLPAHAEAPPADVTAVNGSVGDHAALLSYTNGAPKAIVRDVTGVGGTLTSASGSTVSAGPASARDTRFTNLVSRTYAVWAAASDGTPSNGYQTFTVPPVGAVPTSIAIGVSRGIATYGTKYGVIGTLLRNDVRSPNQRLDLLARVGGTKDYKVVRRLTTDSDGNVKAELVSTRSIDLALRYAGDSFSAASGSEHKVVQMQPVITAGFSPAVVVRPESTTFSGALPGGLGAGLKIQRRTSSGYGTLKTVTPDSTGKWTYAYTPGGVGTFSYRVVLDKGVNYLGATSPVRTLEVDTRNLALGNEGADVLSLKKQLLALHYSPGALNTTFDKNLLHAVYAFDKVEGLPRNGTWTRTERTRIAKPRGIKLRYPASGRAVEVDVTKQVLIYSEGGAIKMIVDTSTGGEYRYYYEGGSDVAHTPRGNFVVQRKIDGVRTSKLGYLYRPSYFTGGFAVHGEGYDVPTHPASHGCVRITDYNTDILFSKLVVGTPVHVFDS
jgi:hypothetical protein